MFVTNSTPVELNENVRFSFPNEFCCNCGSQSGLQIVEQDTRQTNYLFGGGTELNFKLPLPFCKNCVPSSKRRSKNFIHRFLVFLIIFGLVALVLMLVGEFFTGGGFLMDYLIPVSLFSALLLTFLWTAAAKPKGQQTSYYQPVRISKLKREFISGSITAIGFSFSNRSFANKFYLLNKDVVKKSLVFVKVL